MQQKLQVFVALFIAFQQNFLKNWVLGGNLAVDKTFLAKYTTPQLLETAIFIIFATCWLLS